MRLLAQPPPVELVLHRTQPTDTNIQRNQIIHVRTSSTTIAHRVRSPHIMVNIDFNRLHPISTLRFDILKFFCI